MTNKPEAPYYPHAAPYPYPVLDAARAMLAALREVSVWLINPDADEKDPLRFYQIMQAAIAQAEAAGIVAQS